MTWGHLRLSFFIFFIGFISVNGAYQLCPTLASSSTSTTTIQIGKAIGVDKEGGTMSQSPLEFSDLIPNPKLYDRMRPPQEVTGEPTKVEFHVTVMGLDSINEYSMTYAADIFVSQRWKDHRLRLPENMTTEYRLLEVGWLQQMWRPDSFFKNAKQVTFQTMTIPNHYLWLYKDKSILYMVKLTLTLSCSMNFALYPHDTQECKLQVESLSHTTDDLIFEWESLVPLVVDNQIELPQLQLVENRTEDCSQVYSTGNFTCLEVVFVLKRRLGYYLFHTYIPTCLIVVMSWISFWIAPEAAPARVTLGVTSLLTLSTQHAKSQAGLPPVSYLKAVDLFMSACTVFVFLALMEYCLVNIVLGDSFDKKNRKHGFKFQNSSRKSYRISISPSFSPISSNRRSIFNSFRRTVNSPKRGRDWPSPAHSSCFMELDDPMVPPAPPPPKPRVLPTTTPAMSENRIRALRIDRYSRIIFPLTFTILNCVYWVTFMEYL